MKHENCGGELLKTRAAHGLGKFQCQTCGAVLNFGKPCTPMQEKRESYPAPDLTYYDNRVIMPWRWTP